MRITRAVAPKSLAPESLAPRSLAPRSLPPMCPAPMSLALLFLALAVSGCALATDTPPSVDVMAVRLVGIGLTEQQLALTLCVTNRSSSEIAFRRVTADFDVSGAPLAAGSSDLAVVLPPQASTAVPFTVVTTVQNLGPQLLGILRTGAVEYRVHGTVTFRGALGFTLPYARSGRLDALGGGLELASAASDPAPSRCALPTGAVGGPRA